MTANIPAVMVAEEGARRRLTAGGESELTPIGHYSAISASRMREVAR
jgi:hypothetical protein